MIQCWKKFSVFFPKSYPYPKRSTFSYGKKGVTNLNYCDYYEWGHYFESRNQALLVNLHLKLIDYIMVWITCNITIVTVIYIASFFICIQILFSPVMRVIIPNTIAYLIIIYLLLLWITKKNIVIINYTLTFPIFPPCTFDLIRCSRNRPCEIGREFTPSPIISRILENKIRKILKFLLKKPESCKSQNRSEAHQYECQKPKKEEKASRKVLLTSFRKLTRTIYQIMN